ncbi:unnamed protein product [Brachionus calyciflorus]|uniref:Apolipoprotein D n=1 Tax=Brachionus calyciflorus TaxID=104777 RepID=A0A813S7Y0_9BILA|nr:unnamed protein product [Brachionus calyciflorus]
MIAYILPIVLIGLSQINAQSVGSCHTTPVLPDFDSSKYLGKWYELERFSFLFEKDLKCVTATYTMLNETTIGVNNYGFNTVKNKDEYVYGSAYVKNSAEPNKLNVVLPVVVDGVTILENSADYNVVATDYNNYALVYSCRQLVPLILKFETSWILSRTKTLDSQTVQNLKNIASSYKIDVSKYEVVPQDCN